MRRDAIEELYKRYYNDALLYSLTIAGDKQLAEDAVQSAFYKALLLSDDSVKNFKSWLLRVCRNELFTRLKRAGRSERLSPEREAVLTDEAESAVENIIRREEYRALHRSMALLKAAEREYLTLYYFEELPLPEMAAVLQKSETATKVGLFRARERLKEIFEAIYENNHKE